MRKIFNCYYLSVANVLLATLIAALGPINFGYALGYTSTNQVEMTDNTKPFHLTEDEFSWFGVSLSGYNCLVVYKSVTYEFTLVRPFVC